MAPSPLSWAQDIRLRAIEILAHWTGRVNTSELMDRFGISRRIAQQDITRYLRLAPGNLVYDRQEKAYLPTSIFRPLFTQGQISEYLALEEQAAEAPQVDNITQISPPSFSLDPQVVRPILNAIRAAQAVRVLYRSLTHPKGLSRILFPHQLVNSGFRWHVRAYCALRQDFRDFNLARVLRSEPHSIPRPLDADPLADRLWQEPVKLLIAPNERLSVEEQTLIRYEFGIRPGQPLAVTCRGCLVQYVLQAYQIEAKTPEDANPQQHRLVLINRDEVAAYLWG